MFALGYYSKPIQFILWVIYGLSNYYYGYYLPYSKLLQFEGVVDDDDGEEEEIAEEMDGDADNNSFSAAVLLAQIQAAMNTNEIRSTNAVVRVSIQFWSVFRVLIIYFLSMPKLIFRRILAYYRRQSRKKSGRKESESESAQWARDSHARRTNRIRTCLRI